MSWNYYGGGEERARVQLEIKRRRKKGEPFVPVEAKVARGIPAETFWGRAWGENLEAYSDYANRLPRGRSYLRKGSVFDLTIEPGEIFAYVAGTGLYEVLIKIDPLDEDRWTAIKTKCAGQIGNLVELLGGKLGAGVMDVVTDLDGGLFPEPREIHLSCSCPDWADCCKHVAATLYGVGVMLDKQPELFFKLRQIDHHELIAGATEHAGTVADLLEGDGIGVLQPAELSELFGIEISEPETAF